MFVQMMLFPVAVFVGGLGLALLGTVTHKRIVWQISIAGIVGGPGALVFSVGLATLLNSALAGLCGYIAGFGLGAATAWWWGVPRKG